MKKTWYIYREYYSAMKKKEILTSVITWMNLQFWNYAKRNKLDRKTQVLYDLTYMWNLKKAKLIEMESRLVVAKGQ